MKTYESYDAFLTDLETVTGYQVYDSRTEDKGVKLPYIVVDRLEDTTMHRDNTRYLKKDSVEVLLLSYQSNDRTKSRRRDEAEKKVESFLDDAGIPYAISYTWINDINLFQTQFSIEVWYE